MQPSNTLCFSYLFSSYSSFRYEDSAPDRSIWSAVPVLKAIHIFTPVQLVISPTLRALLEKSYDTVETSCAGYFITDDTLRFVEEGRTMVYCVVLGPVPGGTAPGKSRTWEPRSEQRRSGRAGPAALGSCSAIY